MADDVKAPRAGDLAHRREYESALKVAGASGPSWDELTEEKREEIRNINRGYWKEMQEFGESLRSNKL